VAVARANGTEPDAGRRLHVWAAKAGFKRSEIMADVGVWCFNTPREREMWAAWWIASADMEVPWARSAVKCGATEEQLERIREEWREWGTHEDAWWTMMHGQVVCRK
jgi:hypothetical protein